MDDKEIMVYVTCSTYNQANYIKDALDGFCMQQTSFPFVCGIIDDASTDGEPMVIQQYLEQNFILNDIGVMRHEETEDYIRIFAQHKTNKNCFFAVVFLKYNHYQIKKTKLPYISEWRDRAKYIAENEGDDYWIDPLKLQKQVDFMEAHPKHSLCFCANQSLLPSGEISIDKRYDSNVEICPIEDIILGGGGYMTTNSMFYRNSLYVSYTTWAIGCPVGDLPLMLTLAHKGFVGYLADVMCVYRINTVGSWSSGMGDIKKRRRHHKAIIKMWRQFDSWSGKRYHKIVVAKIRMNQKDHLRDEASTMYHKLLKYFKK